MEENKPVNISGGSLSAADFLTASAVITKANGTSNEAVASVFQRFMRSHNQQSPVSQLIYDSLLRSDLKKKTHVFLSSSNPFKWWVVWPLPFMWHSNVSHCFSSFFFYSNGCQVSWWPSSNAVNFGLCIPLHFTFFSSDRKVNCQCESSEESCATLHSTTPVL